MGVTESVKEVDRVLLGVELRVRELEGEPLCVGVDVREGELVRVLVSVTLATMLAEIVLLELLEVV